jgi:dTDP-4-dehydrorhamnose 3,5-epimerase
MNFVKQTIKSDSIGGLVCYHLDTFKDNRGEIWTLYDTSFTEESFTTDKLTISTYGVLRGFHGDSDTTKLITCLRGKFHLAVVDLRADSPTYGAKEEFLVDSEEPTVILVPKGCINAHLCLSRECLFYYKWSKPYTGPENQVTVKWNDPEIGIRWPIENPTLSERDKNGTPYKETLL